jgi:hypothetical protein
MVNARIEGHAFWLVSEGTGAEHCIYFLIMKTYQPQIPTYSSRIICP